MIKMTHINRNNSQLTTWQINEWHTQDRSLSCDQITQVSK